jgi:hypothetical protein
MEWRSAFFGGLIKLVIRLREILWEEVAPEDAYRPSGHFDVQSRSKFVAQAAAAFHVAKITLSVALEDSPIAHSDTGDIPFCKSIRMAAVSAQRSGRYMQVTNQK